MTWEQEYRSKRDEEDDLVEDHVRRLQDKIAKLEKDSTRKHRKAIFWTWVGLIAWALTIWALYR